MQSGGFDASFVGWGPEDTEFLSRLLEIANLHSLYGRADVFHIDHYVSPYRGIESHRNVELYRKRLLERSSDFDVNGFADRILGALDGNISGMPGVAEAERNMSN
jgi:hypothetical protein